MRYFMVPLVFLVVLFLSDGAKAQPINYVELCLTDEGIASIIENNGFGIKPDVYQMAALRNAGQEPLKDYEAAVNERCDNVLENPENAAVIASQSSEAQSFSFNPDLPVAFVQEHSFDSFGCSVSWDKGSCKKERTFQVPAGRQACALRYRWRWENDHDDPVVKPVLFYTGDVENPDRFRGYRIKLKARGNGNGLDPKKGKVRAYKIRLYSIAADNNNKVRFNTGCEMPAINSNPAGDVIIPEIDDIPSVPSE